MGEATHWIIPTAKWAIEHRAELIGYWDRIKGYLAFNNVGIAITGSQGAGKTVLFDHITGKGLMVNYQPPHRSISAESALAKSGGKRMSLLVVPGQRSQPRYIATDKAFGKKPVCGVIHVVCNGFVDERNRVIEEAFVRERGLATTEQYRHFQLNRELEDLGETCELIRQSVRRTGKPAWLLVAATKADLFAGSVSDAEQYYSEFGDSKFTHRLRLLQSQLGGDNFRWTASPVATWLGDFRWNGETTPSSISVPQRNHLLASFMRLLEGHCAGN